MSTSFDWSKEQRRPDGKLLLLYRHERLFAEPWMAAVVDVLDVGGWGMLAKRLLEEGKRATILDLFTGDQYYADRVRALPHKAGSVCDPSNFAPASFDLVTCFETLEHCGNIPAALASAFLWLRPGGVFAGTVPIPGFAHHAGEPDTEFVTAAELARLLAVAGFVVEAVTPTPSVGLPDEPDCSLYFVAKKPSEAR